VTTNFLQDILEEAGDEAIEAIVIGEFHKGRGGRFPDGLPFNVTLSVEEAKVWLDYDYYGGYGGEECHPIYAWTKTRVLAVSAYDGATCVTSIPRHPQMCQPEYS